MAFKFITILALVAAASAQFVDYHQGHNGYQASPVHGAYKHHEIEAPAKYDFDYSVHDTQTGDIKQQHEVRDGDSVHGSYSLVDADGLHRIVEYTADAHTGFQATVRREPLTKPLEPIHKAAPVHYTPAPAVHYAPTPVHHAPAPVQYTPAPVHRAPAPAHYQHSAPSAHSSHNAGHVSINTPNSNYQY